MPVIVQASQLAPTVTTIGPITPGSAPPTVTAPPSGSDALLPTFQFVAGWVLLITFLVFVSKSRLGYVIIYYSLVLIILFILVTEYQQITPYINAIQTIGQFNTSKSVS